MSVVCCRIMLPDGSIVAMSPAARQTVLATVEEMAAKALRCLALANKVRAK